MVNCQQNITKPPISPSVFCRVTPPSHEKTLVVGKGSCSAGRPAEKNATQKCWQKHAKTEKVMDGEHVRLFFLDIKNQHVCFFFHISDALHLQAPQIFVGGISSSIQRGHLKGHRNKGSLKREDTVLNACCCYHVFVTV